MERLKIWHPTTKIRQSNFVLTTLTPTYPTCPSPPDLPLDPGREHAEKSLCFLQGKIQKAAARIFIDHTHSHTHFLKKFTEGEGSRATSIRQCTFHSPARTLESVVLHAINSVHSRRSAETLAKLRV